MGGIPPLSEQSVWGFAWSRSGLAQNACWADRVGLAPCDG
jgi:hypothetical protein